ncbi:MAG TPA: hypothetical protein DGB32_03885 [Dehalococcoidia bacterium]|nr:hypothetical protein [Dehalococcoidia bacterium]
MTVGLERQSERHRGITGLETAIIVIAFVVVASAFAFTVLSTGVFSAERSKDTVYAGLSEVRSSLATRGSFVAFFGKVSSTQTRTNSVSLSPRPSAVAIPSILRRRIRSTTPAPTRTSSPGPRTGWPSTTRTRTTSFPTFRGPWVLSGTATRTTCSTTMKRLRSPDGFLTGTRRRLSALMTLLRKWMAPVMTVEPMA